MRVFTTRGDVLSKLERLAALFAIGYVVFFASVLLFTVNGPDPTEPIASEAARAVSEAGQMRLSALLGFFADLALAGFAVSLGRILARQGRRLAGGLAAAAGTAAAAVGAVSSAALIVAVQSAKRDYGADVFAAFGDLHTAALLLQLAPVGALLLAASFGGLGRVLSALAILVGAGCIIGSAAVMSAQFDRGPLGFGVVIWFVGLPLWLIATSVVLWRRGARDTGEPQTAG